MGRWTQYDEDSYRLPEGMKRIGYDADTGRYTFQDRDGSLWTGAQGAEFSEMTRVSGPTRGRQADEGSDDAHEDDMEAQLSTTRGDGYAPLSNDPLNTPMAHHQGVNAGAYQNLLPFLLMIGVFLLIVWRYVFPALIPPESEPCPTNTEAYWVKPGDSCWAIANGHDCPFERFKELNPEVNCDVLMPGSTICLPIQPTTKPTS